MRALSLILACLGACAAPAEITVQSPPALMDSYPGNGSVLPPEQVSPLLLVFNQALATDEALGRHLSVHPVGDDELLPLASCTLPQPSLLECPLALQPRPGTRYEVELSPDLPFVNGQTLAISYKRWFETL